MGGERLFKLSIFSYCNSVISTFNLNVLFHSIMGLSTLNVVHLTYSTNTSLLKILRQRVTLVFLSKFYLSGFTVHENMPPHVYITMWKYLHTAAQMFMQRKKVIYIIK